MIHNFQEVYLTKEHFKEVVPNQSDTPYVIFNSKVDLEEVIVDNQQFQIGHKKLEFIKNNGA